MGRADQNVVLFLIDDLGWADLGLTLEEPVITTDLHPTILELAGLPLRPEQHVDGVSLDPLLTEKESLERETTYFHYPHYHHINTMGPSDAVRMGDYKLIEVFETVKVELYNLSDDFAASMPELTAKLTKMLHDWRVHSGAVMTTDNPDYKAENDWRNHLESLSFNESDYMRPLRMAVAIAAAMLGDLSFS